MIFLVSVHGPVPAQIAVESVAPPTPYTPEVLSAFHSPQLLDDDVQSVLRPVQNVSLEDELNPTENVPGMP
jgi:hypothetical protein